MRKCLLIPALAFLCSLLVALPAPAQVQKLFIHPKAAGNEKQSQFVDSIRFIPLEARQGVEFGTNNNLTITTNYFLINDYAEKKLHVYAKNGAFVKEVSYKRLGENFYPGYHENLEQVVFFANNKNYALTSKDQVQIRLDWSNPRNKKYFKKYGIDLNDPSFAIKKATPQEYDINRAHYYFDGYYWRGEITTSPLYTDSVDYELKLYKGNQLVKGFFPYDPVHEPRYLFTQENINLNKTTTPFVSFITRPYCDTIYKLTGDSLAPAYQLVLPLENSVPPSLFNKAFKSKTERENFERNNGWMFKQVYNFNETDRFLLFAIRYQMNFESYIYQKQTNKAFKTKNIKADSSQYNLSLLDGFGSIRSGERFYKLQKAGDLALFFEKHPSVPVPKELERFLQDQPHSSSPLIVEFQLKN